jgi:phosphate starvation-inducible PhoH-like protein
MAEVIKILEDIDPVAFFGVNNVIIDKIKGQFPKLKIIVRDNMVKCVGEDNELMAFNDKFERIIAYFKTYNHIDDGELEKFLSDNNYIGTSKEPEFAQTLLYGSSGKPVRARTLNQLMLVNESVNNDLIIAEGPAGTGKTYTSIALAVRALKDKRVKRIILTRPAVEAGERLGFLPGDMKEKLDPYLQPLYDALQDMLPFKKLETWLEDGTIQIAPLAFMRGRTLENAFVILDEAQNASISQLKMFLTRMGVSSKFILTGDSTQIDLPKKGDSGLLMAMKILDGIEGISIIRFDENDIVRHKLVRRIVRAYEEDEKNICLTK